MYAFIDCNRGRYTVEMMARVLRISPRSYYDHKRGKHNLREQRREALERLIQQVYAAAKGRYGAPRIAAEIHAKHHYVSVNTVSKYMKRMRLRSKLSRKYRNVNYPELLLSGKNTIDIIFLARRPFTRIFARHFKSKPP